MTDGDGVEKTHDAYANREGRLTGAGSGEGFCLLRLLQRDSELYVIDHDQIETEKARIEDAINDVRQSLALDARRIEGRLEKKGVEAACKRKRNAS